MKYRIKETIFKTIKDKLVYPNKIHDNVVVYVVEYRALYLPWWRECKSMNGSTVYFTKKADAENYILAVTGK